MSQPKAPAASVISAPAACVGGIGDAGGDAGARLHAHRVALRLELLGRLRRDGDAGFAGRRLERNADQHGDLLGAALEFGPSLHEDDKELAEDRIPLYSSASRMTGAQIAGFVQ